MTDDRTKLPTGLYGAQEGFLFDETVDYQNECHGTAEDLADWWAFVDRIRQKERERLADLAERFDTPFGWSSNDDQDERDYLVRWLREGAKAD